MSNESRLKNLAWIAVDWGTSHLRLWALSASGEILARTQSDRGMATLQPQQFEATLLALISDWLPSKAVATPVIACGMVGAKQGWQEVPYRAVPCPLQPELVSVPTRDSRISMHICAGLSQADPADVMRGEETQIAGLVQAAPGFDGIACLPGTHSKWAQIGGGRVERFQSFMTGELFALLSKQSVLRFSIDLEEWNDTRFDHAVLDALADPAAIAARLFALRAESLVAKQSSSGNGALLSGYLIGLELAAARSFWAGASRIAIIGSSTLARLYQRALRLVGTEAELVNTEDMTLSGLRSAFEQLNEVKNV